MAEEIITEISDHNGVFLKFTDLEEKICSKIEHIKDNKSMLFNIETRKVDEDYFIRKFRVKKIRGSKMNNIFISAYQVLQSAYDSKYRFETKKGAIDSSLGFRDYAEAVLDNIPELYNKGEFYAVILFEDILRIALKNNEDMAESKQDVNEKLQKIKELGRGVAIYSTSPYETIKLGSESVGQNLEGVTITSTYDFQTERFFEKTIEGLRNVGNLIIESSGKAPLYYCDDKMKELKKAEIAFDEKTKLYHVGGREESDRIKITDSFANIPL